MNKENLKDLFLNWKGLELMHSLKSISKIILIILSIIFVLVSVRVQNYYILATSLIILFLQVMSENSKEYYLKYKELFEKIKNEKQHTEYKDWIDFLEKTKGLNSIYKLILWKCLYKKFKKISKNGTENKIQTN